MTAVPCVAPPSTDSVRTARPDRESSTRRRRRERTAELLARSAVTTDELEARRLRDEVVRLNLEVAESLALRFRARGLVDEDLVQVACLGLVKAVQRFDPEQGHDFLSFAVPTIRGEVKRHFRDHGWTIRPPRQVQEVQARIGAVEPDLMQALGRAPRPAELAAELGASEEDVLRAQSATGCFTPSSIDTTRVGSGGRASLAERLGDEDDGGTSAAEARVVLAPAVRRLSARDRRILYLRYFEELNQQEIGAEIGVTQMQVSRLLARILRDLRRFLDDPVAEPEVCVPRGRTTSAPWGGVAGAGVLAG